MVYERISSRSIDMQHFFIEKDLEPRAALDSREEALTFCAEKYFDPQAVLDSRVECPLAQAALLIKLTCAFLRVLLAIVLIVCPMQAALALAQFKCK